MCLVKKWDYLEDHFARLEEKIKEEQQKLKPLTDEEKERIQLELDIIKKTDTASIFLLYGDIMSHLKGVGAVFHGLMHCSYVCYLLGLTKVNPLHYGLPFERYYNVHRCISFPQNPQRSFPLPFRNGYVKKRECTPLFIIISFKRQTIMQRIDFRKPQQIAHIRTMHHPVKDSP